MAAIRVCKPLHVCLLWLAVSALSSKTGDCIRKNPKPCMNLVFYFHDIMYNGDNAHNATSAVVGSPSKAENLANEFGLMVVFDDPLTLDNNLHSPAVGRAQGLYFYDSQKVLGAWFGFTVVLNSTEYRGTMSLAGADYPIADKYRYFSVMGGTGDFFMARGIAAVSTDEAEGIAYFRLRFNITLYECYGPVY